MEYKDFGFYSAEPTHMHKHFLPAVFELTGPASPGMRVLDIGCGNGYTAGQFLQKGCEVVGVDLGVKGLDIARQTYPQARFALMGADSKILEKLEEAPFDVVVSTEVIEHLYAPRQLISGAYAALRPGGRFICTTPYHGYLKNLVLALVNRWDRHLDPLSDGGHIKFWSKSTLFQLLTEAGFTNLQFRGAGRIPGLWMTMIVSGDKPSQP